MKDTTLTELLDLMKAYAERHNVELKLSLKTKGEVCLEYSRPGETYGWVKGGWRVFNSLPDLIEKLNS